jgi:hypothetical protein
MSDAAGRGKASRQRNKDTIFCEYSTCKRFKDAAKGGPGQGFPNNKDRDCHHATHESGRCDEKGTVKRSKKSK